MENGLLSLLDYVRLC